MKYVDKTKIKGAFYIPAVQEESSLLVGQKYKNRKQINEEVFDTEDAVADNAKMISLLMSIVSRIYSIIPESEKNDLDPIDRDIIEYSIEKFKEIQTRADKQFQVEGSSLIDKLFERQNTIGNILDLDSEPVSGINFKDKDIEIRKKIL